MEPMMNKKLKEDILKTIVDWKSDLGDKLEELDKYVEKEDIVILENKIKKILEK